MMARRDKVWEAIRQVVQGVPSRDHCYILGDLNTPCVTRAGHCGAGVLEQRTLPQTWKSSWVFSRLLICVF